MNIKKLFRTVSICFIVFFSAYLLAETSKTTLQEVQGQVQDLQTKLEHQKELQTLRIDALDKRIDTAVNNSQKNADWWLSAVGGLLTLVGLVVTIFGIGLPIWLTRKQKRELNEKIAEFERIKNQVEEHVKAIEDMRSQSEAKVQAIEKHLTRAQAANFAPEKVQPGSQEALQVLNAMAQPVTKNQSEANPLELLRLNALKAQAENRWADALSFWRQIVATNPTGSLQLQALRGEGVSLTEAANIEVDPERQQALREKALGRILQAQQACDRRAEPLEWAELKEKTGSLLRVIGESESGTERLEQAVSAYEKALEERTRERVPMAWAATQHHLGFALHRLGERKSGTEWLEQAVSAYEKALEERTRERVPLNWAMTQNNLGNALLSLARRERGTERLDQALNAYKKALEEHTRERVPLNWAMTQNNLGNAFKVLGERNSETGKLEQAVSAYEKALEERTRERVPLDWAMTQNNLGTALWALGKRESGTKRLEQAAQAFEAALTVYEAGKASHYVEMAQRNLKQVQAIIAERKAKGA
jgi:tetratricopeptide (TPR) repeat protein